MKTIISISVVIPTYNLEGFLQKTLESILNQTSLPEEIIIVDDGSTDGTVTIVKRLIDQVPKNFICLLQQDHQGVSTARNAGIKQAKGDWISFLDGDDTWLPEKLARVRQVILEHPEVGMIAHDMYRNQQESIPQRSHLQRRYDSSTPLFPQLYHRNFLATSCLTVQREILLNVGGFDPHKTAAEDYDLWLKVARHKTLHFIPEALTYYTVLREGRLTANVQAMHNNGLKVAQEHAPYLASYINSPWVCYWYFLEVILFVHYYSISLFREQNKILEALGTLIRLPIEAIALTFSYLLATRRRRQNA